MSYEVLTIPPFDKQAKRLSKKYPSFKKEFGALITSLQTSPKQGTALGNNCYKIRISIASKGKGKSGGALVITYVQVTAGAVYLLSIYDKAEQENIKDAELSELLKFIP